MGAGSEREASTGHIEVDGEVVVVAGAGEGELGGISRGGDEVVAAREHFLGVFGTEALRRG